MSSPKPQTVAALMQKMNQMTGDVVGETIQGIKKAGKAATVDVVNQAGEQVLEAVGMGGGEEKDQDNDLQNRMMEKKREDQEQISFHKQKIAEFKQASEDEQRRLDEWKKQQEQQEQAREQRQQQHQQRKMAAWKQAIKWKMGSRESSDSKMGM